MLESTLISPVGTILWHNGPTAAAEETFTRGDCWALAWALSQALPTAQLYTLGDQNDWRHVVVRLAEDLYLDFTGLRTGEELSAEWSGQALFPVPAVVAADYEYYRDYLGSEWEFEPGMATVQAFADLLIKAVLPIDFFVSSV